MYVLLADPFYKLEYAAVDRQKAKEIEPDLDKLIKFRDQRENDYQLSSLARNSFRSQKAELSKRLKEAERLGLSIPLLPVDVADEVAVQQVSFQTNERKYKMLQQRLDARSETIFPRKQNPENGAKRAKICFLSTQNILMKSNAPKRTVSDAMKDLLPRLSSKAEDIRKSGDTKERVILKPAMKHQKQ